MIGRVVKTNERFLDTQMCAVLSYAEKEIKKTFSSPMGEGQKDELQAEQNLTFPSPMGEGHIRRNECDVRIWGEGQSFLQNRTPKTVGKGLKGGSNGKH